MPKFFLLAIFFISTSYSQSPLSATEVFSLKPQLIDPNNFAINWQIKPGYFLYKDKITIKTDDGDTLELGNIRWPEPQIKTDKLNHKYPIYPDNFTTPVGLLGKHAGEALVKINYQGCSNAGFCYPPQQTEIKLSIDTHLALKDITQENSSLETQNLNSNNAIPTIFATSHWPLILISFLGFGLLLSFTPCVLPMVPVLSGIIVGHGSTISTPKAFFLSLSYVLSMASTYALVGALVALAGDNLQIVMQSPWAISIFSLAFVILALSMFDYFELKLPYSWQQKINSCAPKNGGSYISAAIMGAFSTLILSPCVTAPLIGALSYIAETGNVVFGSICLFFLGLGMGIPLLLIGTSAGVLLPKSGQWMNTVKTVFGLLLLMVAISLISRIIPGYFTMLLWSFLLIFTGLYCGALKTKTAILQQGIGIILLMYGLLILIGASLGNTNPLIPLASLNVTQKNENRLAMVNITTVADAKKVLEQATKPIMIDFYADWCSSCKIMAATVLQDKAIVKKLADFTILKVDVTENNALNQKLLNYFAVVAPPTFLFFDKKGQELENARIVGEVNKQSFMRSLNLAF